MANYLVITGGSHGIGKKTIAVFKQQHWRVINISRTDCAIKDVENINIDLSMPDWPEEFTSQLQVAVRDAQCICLVHNAAVFKRDQVGSLSAAALRSVLEVNVVAAVALNKILMPVMPSGSSILYIGSTLSEQAVPHRASYVISKHAVIGLMRATCQDLAEEGIHTCCICPGFVNTKMLTNEINSADLNAFIQSKVIAKRLIEPEEIAECILFCANHPIVNGSILHANLGQVTN